MLNHPPSIPTTLTPVEIIGVEMAGIFLKHYRLQLAESISIKKEIGGDNLAKIITIYRELRANGFYPVGITDHGQIRWATALQGKTTVMLEKDLRDNPVLDIEKEKATARGAFKDIGSPMLEAA